MAIDKVTAAEQLLPICPFRSTSLLPANFTSYLFISCLWSYHCFSARVEIKVYSGRNLSILTFAKANNQVKTQSNQ